MIWNKFLIKLQERIQHTVLNIFKIGVLSWIVGTYLIVKGYIPCNSATEYGIFTAGLIFSVGMTNKLMEK